MNRKKQKLPSIKKTDGFIFQIRLTADEKARAVEARAVLMRPIGQMFREAFYSYYLPYHYNMKKPMPVLPNE